MRCSSCGLPLSPKRTQCPRCGTTAGPEKKEEQRSDYQLGTPQYAFPGNNTPVGMEPQPQWVAQPGQPGQAEMQNQAMAAPIGQSFDQSTLPWSPPADGSYPNNPSPVAPQPGSIYPHLSGAEPYISPPYSSFPPNPQARYPLRARFTVASLCVLTGGFILLLVFIISRGLPIASSGQNLTTNTIPQVTKPVPTPVVSPTTIPTPAVTPTPSLPGQQYVDTVQMASNINATTAQPFQPTSNFRIGQQIFVTFMLHPNNKAGAVCLIWYINQTQFSNYAFAVGAVPESAYSFAYATRAGQGSVQLYWASSNACTDKMLAQVVTFTVS